MSRPTDIPISEWRKRLGFAPDDIIEKTIQNTTQYYLTVECKECEEPCRHFKSRVPALRAKCQNESMSSDTYFPSVKSG